VARDEFGRRVEHDVRAQLQRTLPERCGERVVDEHQRAGFAPGPTEHVQFGDLERRIGRGLQQDEVGADHRLHGRLGVRHIDQTGRQIMPDSGLCEASQRSEVGVPGGDDHSVGCQQFEYGTEGGEA
jgi:hypothetical protein